MADGKEASIIVKKIKKGGHGGHHGGAWKVAYADFVTAMMAFFLLLWLLQATAQSQKEGIAEYFTPTVGIRDAAGIGFKGGKTSWIDGQKVQERSPPSILVGRMPQGPTAQKEERQSPSESTQEAYLYERGGQHAHMSETGGNDVKKQDAKPAQATTTDTNTPNDRDVYEKAEDDIRQAIEEDPNFRDFKDNVIVEQSPEGLKIDVIDDDKLPMFEAKGTQITQAGERVLRMLADVVRQMPNRISITGHTEATNYAEPGGLYTGWELSADRANAARRFFMTTNMEPTRVAKVTGRADQELLDPKHPTSPRNRRVTIILLRNSYLKTLDSQASAPRNLLTVPKPTEHFTPKPKPAPPPPPVEAPKKEPKAAPATRAGKTNVKKVPAEFKMPESLKQSIRDGQSTPGTSNESPVPQNLLTAPEPPHKPVAAPPAPAVVPKPKPATPTVEASPALRLPPVKKAGNISGEFKMPESLRRSIDGNAQENGAPAAPRKTNEGLHSLPSGLIQTDEE